MSERSDAHRRFTAWLLGTRTDELSRDLALHASVCPECVGWVAGLDLLAGIDVERAGPPGPLPAVGRLGQALGLGLRVARIGGAVAAAALVLVVLGSGAGPWLAGLGLFGPTPEEGVLGQTATPAPTESIQQSASPNPSPSASGSVEETSAPSYAPFSPPVTPHPTPRPTPVATAVPTPVPTEIPTPVPTEIPTPSPTPSPTPAGPTVPGAPINLQATAGPLTVSLSWTTPADGGSPITDFQVCRAIADSGPYDTCFWAGATATGYVDADPGLVAGTTYWYVVKAVNAIGTSDGSNLASAVPL